MSNEQHEEGMQPEPETVGAEDVLSPFDLNEDGKVSVVESVRATLGVVDARLIEIANSGGVKGKIAGAAHKVVDAVDND
jgi:hypothetical protein